MRAYEIEKCDRVSFASQVSAIGKACALHKEIAGDFKQGGFEMIRQQGYATEGTRASVMWALEHPAVRMVQATTPSWHTPSRRVLEKCGFSLVGSRESDAMLGELHEFELRR